MKCKIAALLLFSLASLTSAQNPDAIELYSDLTGIPGFLGMAPLMHTASEYPSKEVESFLSEVSVALTKNGVTQTALISSAVGRLSRSLDALRPVQRTTGTGSATRTAGSTVTNTATETEVVTTTPTDNVPNSAHKELKVVSAIQLYN